MSDDTTTQSASTKSTSQPPSWQGSEHPIVKLHLVFWLIVMTPSIVSLALIWLLANMSHRGLESVLTQAASGESILKSVGEKFNTQVLSPSLKNLNQLSDAVRKTVLEVDQLLSTFPYGTKKSETSSSSKTTKEPKTTESESSTTVSS